VSERELKQAKQQLLALKAELQALEKTVKENIQPIELDQAKVGRLSRMDAMQGQQMAVAANRRRQQQLVRIDGALNRIDSGDYGYCFICDKQIDPRRLTADPTNTCCVECVE
jgi:RNA polymerase-binding transcription factor